jgi:lipid A 3-O-deacylase
MVSRVWETMAGNLPWQATCLFILLLLRALPVMAEERPVAASDGEFSLLAGYGITHRGFGATRTQVQTADAILRYGHFLSDNAGAGRWFEGRHELLVELPLHVSPDHDGRVMTGGYLLGSWKFTGLDDRKIYPYVFAGGGVLYVGLGLPTMGSRLDFSYQGGTGLQYLIRKRLAITGEYRYHHVSNAGTAEPNEPLNTGKFLLGLSFFH